MTSATDTPEQFIVVPSNENNRRVYFAGTESDARAYVVANFPRPHVEPGQTQGIPIPDVYVVSPTGVKAGYDGSVWDDETDTLTPEPVAAPEPAAPNPDAFTTPNGETFVYDPDTDTMVKQVPADVTNAGEGTE